MRAGRKLFVRGVRGAWRAAASEAASAGVIGKVRDDAVGTVFWLGAGGDVFSDIADHRAVPPLRLPAVLIDNIGRAE